MNAFVPHSKPGWWAGWLLVGMAALIGLMQGLVLAGQSGSDGAADHPALGVMGLAAGLCALGGLVTGIIALTKSDRSVPVWIAVVLGLAVAFFVVSDLLIQE